jgi:hypothetical protein
MTLLEPWRRVRREAHRQRIERGARCDGCATKCDRRELPAGVFDQDLGAPRRLFDHDLARRRDEVAQRRPAAACAADAEFEDVAARVIADGAKRSLDRRGHTVAPAARGPQGDHREHLAAFARDAAEVVGPRVARQGNRPRHAWDYRRARFGPQPSDGDSNVQFWTVVERIRRRAGDRVCMRAALLGTRPDGHAARSRKAAASITTSVRRAVCTQPSSRQACNACATPARDAPVQLASSSWEIGERTTIPSSLCSP